MAENPTLLKTLAWNDIEIGVSLPSLIDPCHDEAKIMTVNLLPLVITKNRCVLPFFFRAASFSNFLWDSCHFWLVARIESTRMRGSIRTLECRCV
jgi:hypothetical protein